MLDLFSMSKQVLDLTDSNMNCRSFYSFFYEKRIMYVYIYFFILKHFLFSRNSQKIWLLGLFNYNINLAWKLFIEYFLFYSSLTSYNILFQSFQEQNRICTNQKYMCDENYLYFKQCIYIHLCRPVNRYNISKQPPSKPFR